MEESWDLVVAGGGPACCVLAAKVAQEGAKVLLLEKEPEPGRGRMGADQLFEGYVSGLPYAREKIFGDGGAIPIRRPWNSLVGDGLLTAGDSACQVIPIHGSGTASALIAADLAAHTVVEALKNDVFDREALWGYSHAFMSTRGAVLAYYDVVREHADTLTVRDLDRMIEKGMLTADVVYSGLVPEPAGLDLAKVPKQLLGGVTSLPLLAGFAVAGLKAVRTAWHYRRYPRDWSPRGMTSWQRGIPS